MTAFMRDCGSVLGQRFDDASFYRFSIEQYPDFWRRFLAWSGIAYEGETQPVCTGSDVEHASFFPNLRLSYPENLLRVGSEAEGRRVALTSRDSAGAVRRLSREELRDQVLRLAEALRQLGVRPGDRVAAIVPNSAEAVVAALATAALGATFSSAAPDMGAAAILSRFEQLEPTVLVAELEAEIPGSSISIADRLRDVVAGLPSLRMLLALDDPPAGADLGLPTHHLSDLLRTQSAAPSDQRWERFPFNHPLFILFSSGTTGPPKCILHGVGGTLLEHVKEHRLHCDLTSDDKLFFHTSTGWMMWNWQLSALACGAEIVLYNGPMADAESLWRIVSDEEVTVFGTSPGYLQLCSDSAYVPRRDLSLASLRGVLSTGSILHDRQYDWVHENVGSVPLQSISGGTDIIGCFVLGNPNLPVYHGESQCRSLGLDVQAVPPANSAGTADVGELVCRNPFPSRPLGFMGDSNGERFHDAYFSQHTGVWTHGDLIEITCRGSARMHGRSDGVLNVRGLRIGPAEIYRALEAVPEIGEAMAVEQRLESSGHSRIVLLVVMRDGFTLDAMTRAEIRRILARDASRAHVPSVIAEVDALPVTHSGKRSERAARDALNGDVLFNAEALRNPDCLDAIRTQVAIEDRRPADTLRFGVSDPHATLEDQLATIWRDVLGVWPIQREDDFFEIGGTSLLTVPLFQAIHDRLGRSLPLSTIISAPTVASMASVLREQTDDQWSPLVLLKPGVGQTPLFIAPGLRGEVLGLRPLARALATDRPVYGVRTQSLFAGDQPHQRVEEIAEHQTAHIRSLQPVGPYALSGYSFGGLIAYEIARRLRSGGERVEFLGLIDTLLPWALLTPRERLRQAVTLPVSWIDRVRIDPIGKLRRSVGRRSLVAQGTRREAPSYYAWVRDTNLVAQASYSPGKYGGDATFFKAARRRPLRCDPLPIWSRLIDGTLSVPHLPGGHGALLTPQQVARLADMMSAELDRAQARGTDSASPPPS
jgi:acetoacetyl-CoA synthetase